MTLRFSPVPKNRIHAAMAPIKIDGLIRYIFIRNARWQPIGCVAYQILERNPAADMDSELPVVLYGSSFYNPKDKFIRKLGRETALDKLTKEPLTVLLNDDNDIRDVLCRVFDSIHKNDKTPNRIKKTMILPFFGNEWPLSRNPLWVRNSRGKLPGKTLVGTNMRECWDGPQKWSGRQMTERGVDQHLGVIADSIDFLVNEVSELKDIVDNHFNPPSPLPPENPCREISLFDKEIVVIRALKKNCRS